MIIEIAFSSDPDASTTAPIRPSTISEKYSAGPNLKASSVSGGAKAAMTTGPPQPAKNEPSAAVAKAAPARPWRAIWQPSIAVTTDEDAPGPVIRIDVREAPH